MDARAHARTVGPWPALAAGFALLTVATTLAAVTGAVGPVLAWNVSWTAVEQPRLRQLKGLLASRR